jgi:rubrerythrin
MDFLNKALEMEISTIELYKTLAEQCVSHEGIRRILVMLTADHENHLESLKSAQEKADFTLEDQGLFQEVKKQLSGIKVVENTFSCDIDQLKLYKKAREFILEKQEFYQKTRDRFKDPAAREYLDRLIRQEKKQAFVLDNIIQMVERPETWLEDAEFSHLDEY